MLKPLPAKIPDTRERTPGSFWTRQLRICLFVGRKKKEKLRQYKSNIVFVVTNCTLFVWLKTRRRRIVENICYSFLRAACSWYVEYRERRGSNVLSPLIVKRRGRIIYWLRGLWGFFWCRRILLPGITRTRKKSSRDQRWAKSRPQHHGCNSCPNFFGVIYDLLYLVCNIYPCDCAFFSTVRAKFTYS